MNRTKQNGAKLASNAWELHSWYEQALVLFADLAGLEGVSDAPEYKKTGEALDICQLSHLLYAIIEVYRQRAGISTSFKMWGEIVIDLYEKLLAYQPLEVALALDAYVADASEFEDQLSRMCLLVEQAPEQHAILTRQMTARLHFLGLSAGSPEFEQCNRHLLAYADYLEYFHQNWRSLTPTSNGGQL